MSAIADTRDVKTLVAEAFSRAAGSYDDLACVQKTSGLHLLDRASGLQPIRILDIGCGSGWMCRHLMERFPHATLWVLDLAPGMVGHVRDHVAGLGGLVQADMEALPFRDSTFDLLYSNFAMQWLDAPERFFADAYRLLVPGGTLCCSTLLPGTLRELGEAWAGADGRTHVNRFLPAERVLQAARDVGFRVLHRQETSIVHYADVFALIHALKGIGANTLTAAPRPAGGLAGRRALQAMQAVYERYREPQGLPATYEVLYCTLTRPAT